MDNQCLCLNPYAIKQKGFDYNIQGYLDMILKRTWEENNSETITTS